MITRILRVSCWVRAACLTLTIVAPAIVFPWLCSSSSDAGEDNGGGQGVLLKCLANAEIVMGSGGLIISGGPGTSCTVQIKNPPPGAPTIRLIIMNSDGGLPVKFNGGDALLVNLNSRNNWSQTFIVSTVSANEVSSRAGDGSVCARAFTADGARVVDPELTVAKKRRPEAAN